MYNNNDNDNDNNINNNNIIRGRRSNIQINSHSGIDHSRIETCKIFPNFDLCRTYGTMCFDTSKRNKLLLYLKEQHG